MNKQEQAVLKQFNIENFRHITKDMVMQLSSSFDKLSSEVQEKIIDQIPNFTEKALDAIKACKDVFHRNMDSDDAALKDFCNLQSKRMDILAEQLKRDDIDAKDKKIILSEIKDATMQFSKKEEDHHKDHEQDGKMMAALAALLILVVGAVLGVNFNKK